MCTCISCRATVVSLEDFEVRLNQVNWNAPGKKNDGFKQMTF